MKLISYCLIFLVIFFSFLGCSPSEISKSNNLPTQTPTVPKKSLSEINLTTIKHISPKGRAQDGSLEDDNFAELSIADELLSHGKDCIPFLISKLDDETELKRGTVDFWYEVYVGDIALIILTDLFTKPDAKTSTILFFSWDDFLERGNDKASMGEEILRRYIKKNGRKKIKERWQKMWDAQKENIFWNEKERCFDVKRASA